MILDRDQRAAGRKEVKSNGWKKARTGDYRHGETEGKWAVLVVMMVVLETAPEIVFFTFLKKVHQVRKFISVLFYLYGFGKARPDQ